MSLRLRLNLLVSFLFLVMLFATTSLVIKSARDSVARELDSSARLALDLLQFALGGKGNKDYPDTKLLPLEQLTQLEKFRHLHLRVVTEETPAMPPGENETGIPSAAPALFVWLVRPAVIPWRQRLTMPAGQAHEVIITADPTDEINEAWAEACPLLGLILLLLIFGNVLIYIMIGHWLRPVVSIQDGLNSIEHGDYHRRLTMPSLPELAAIVGKFNMMAEVLERTQAENSALTQRTLTIQEAERRYLARELHDEFGQSLSAIKAVAVSINQANLEPRISQGLQTICATAGQVYEGVRQMMRRLRPAILDEFGLVTALQEMIDDWNAHQEDTFCRFTLVGDIGKLSEVITINCYRIVQEALTNVLKHARAHEVEVSLRYTSAADTGEGWLNLSIVDDGVGMDSKKTTFGLGLFGIRERVEALRGRLRVRSSPGAGMALEIELPVRI